MLSTGLHLTSEFTGPPARRIAWTWCCCISTGRVHSFAGLAWLVGNEPALEFEPRAGSPSPVAEPRECR